VATAPKAPAACFTPESLKVCEERRAEFFARRQIVLDGLAKMGLPVPAPPDGAFYVYFDVSGTGMDSWEFCQRALAEAHVALTPGRDFSDATAGTHVRLSYAASRDALHDGLERIGMFLRNLRGSPLPPTRCTSARSAPGRSGSSALRPSSVTRAASISASSTGSGVVRSAVGQAARLLA
jgi:hypothetical protein